DRRMEAVGDVEEQSAVGLDRGPVADQVLERRLACSLRMYALRYLRQLVRIAEEDDRARGAAHRDDVREGHLAGLVDEQRVDGPGHVAPPEEPGSPGGHVEASRAQGRADVLRVGDDLDRVDPCT